MYYVVIKAVVQALRGPRVGWSSIARSGQVQMAGRKGRISPARDESPNVRRRWWSRGR
jgi:hypothetical protein